MTTTLGYIILISVAVLTLFLVCIVTVLNAENYPPLRTYTGWQDCQSASCKAQWAKSKDFGNGKCA